MTRLRAFGASAGRTRRHVRAFGASARQGRPRAAIVVAALLLPLAACGKKGPPLAPLRTLPGPVTELAARRIGPEMQIRFTLPAQNVSGPGRIDLEAVEIYAVTVAPGGIVPPNRELLTRKYLVRSLPVRPLPPEDEAPAESEPGKQPGTDTPPPKPEVKDERPLPGERVTFVEKLTEAELTPAITGKPPVAAKGVAPVVPPALEPPVLTRIYVVRGRSHRGDAGAQSARVALPIVAEPQPPPAVQAAVTERAVTLSWTEPPAAIDPVAAANYAQAWAAATAPPPPAVAPARPPTSAPSAPAVDPGVLVPLTRLPGVQLPQAVILPTPPRYNVYAVKEGVVEETPLNATPLTVATYGLGEPVWNEERCFVVRSLRAYGVVTIESPASSPPACVTAIDTFPPAAPAGLRAVALGGEMNLIWEPNSEPDLAGYLVLRGEAPGDTLQAVTSAPITETSYKDATVKPGVRYVYAVVAVDKAPKPNVSPQSTRVEEMAR